MVCLFVLLPECCVPVSVVFCENGHENELETSWFLSFFFPLVGVSQWSQMFLSLTSNMMYL